MATKTGPDLAEFEAFLPAKGPRCGLDTVLATLGKDDAAKLRAALDAPHITHAAISKWLKQHGQNVAAETVGRHRRKDCACDRA